MRHREWIVSTHLVSNSEPFPVFLLSGCSTGDDDRLDIEVPLRNETKLEPGNEGIGEQHRMHEESARNADLQIKDTSMMILPELEQLTGYDPLVVPMNTNLNNDIYFIGKET